MHICIIWTSSHHQKLWLYLLFESQCLLLHNLFMKFPRRNTACFGKMTFVIYISSQIIAALGAGGIEGPFSWVEYLKARPFGASMVCQRPYPERARGLVFLWLVLSLPDYMLLPTGSCSWSNFFPSNFILRCWLFSLTMCRQQMLCFTVNNMICR